MYSYLMFEEAINKHIFQYVYQPDGSYNLVYTILNQV